jgi:quinol monooxygenase YgiN
MIHVIAILTAQPGKLAEVLAAFRENVPLVRGETGCIEYAAAVDTPDVGRLQTRLGPDSFAVIEKWESLEALQAHGQAPHMAAYGARVKDMMLSRVIHVLSPA